MNEQHRKTYLEQYDRSIENRDMAIFWGVAVLGLILSGVVYAIGTPGVL